MNIFKSNLELLKGTRLVSGLFIFASLLVTASIIYSANTYYDIDDDKIIINEAQDIIGTQTITGNMGVSGVVSLGDGGTTNYAQFSDVGDLTLVGTADLISKLDGLLTLQFADASGFVIKDNNGTPVEHFVIDADGTLTLRSASSQDIVFDSASGKIKLGAGDQILTSGDGAASRLAGEQILREIIPIFGFDLPARTKSATFVNVSRIIESNPFPSALTGTTRKYKFIIRYADELETPATSSWNVDNITLGAGSDVAFTIPFSSSTNLDNGDVHIEQIDISAIMTAGNDWQLQVHTEGTKSIQIYEIFLAAYDQVD